jgi:hypothetical protein
MNRRPEYARVQDKKVKERRSIIAERMDGR